MITINRKIDKDAPFPYRARRPGTPPPHCEAAIRPGLPALTALPVFAPLGAKPLALLNQASDLARLGPGEDILAEGETPADLIFLVAGAAAAVQGSARRGGTMTDLVLPPAAIAGPAALMGLPALAGFRTIVSSRLIIVPLPALRGLLERDADLARRFLALALGDLHRLQADAYKLKLCSSAQRLAEYLLELAAHTNLAPPRFVLPFEKRYIAGRIGCSQENLSRAFAALRRVGVHTQGGVVVLRDVPALRAFAGAASPSGQAPGRSGPP